MTINSAIVRFRAKQALQFTTTADVLRPIGEMVWDPDAETSTQGYDTIYSGPCKIRPSKNRSADAIQTHETLVGKPDSEGKFPVDCLIDRNDVVVVTGSLYDTGLVGRRFTVTKASRDEWQIARVAQMEETLVPTLNGA